MSFIIPNDEVVCIAVFKKIRGGIDEIKAFYETLRYHRFKYTNRVDLDIAPRNHFFYTYDPERHFVMGFSDVNTFMVLKLAYSELIVDVWYK